MTEYTLCEKPLIEALESIGWKYIPGRELERENYEEPLLIEELESTIRRLSAGPEYSDLELRDEDIHRAIMKLRAGGTGPGSAPEVLNHIKKGLIPLNLGKRGLRYLPIIDYGNPDNNSFIVSNQVVFRGPAGEMRADIMLFVNGIPLAIIECKDPTDEGLTWYDAYGDIKIYESRVPELFRYVQIGIAACDEIRAFPTVPWSEDVHPSVWRDENGNDGIEGIKAMLSPEALLDIIRNFVFTVEKGGETTKLIPRYMQYYAANRIYRRIVERMEGRSEKNRGLIWHWQGSGKTYTMIFAAYKAYNDRRMEKPSIFFIVDRRELQDQLGKVLARMDLGDMGFEKIKRISELEDVINYDEGRGKRGLFLLLIQKFRPDSAVDEEEGIDREEFERIKMEMRDLPISKRKNIVLFIDEGHRTQYGILASEMKSIFREAFMFAFTGTPISKIGRNTYAEFSYPPDENYLHRYFIDDSIKDGYTVPIVYRFMKEWMEFHRDNFELRMEEIFGEGAEEEKEEVQKRFMPINEILSNPDMIEKKAENIVESFMKRENRGLKGMVVAASRKACVLYKEAIDRYMRAHYPDEWDERFAEVVMTYGNKEKDEIVRRYKERIRKSFPSASFEQINRKIVDDFMEKEYPQLLIVTDKLLTGFDAPVLQIMYLDKVMNGHTLLQAIARTNRPREGKEYGLVMDYVGIFRRFKEALEEYYEMEGSAANVAVNISDLEAELISSLKEMDELLNGDFNPNKILKGERDAIERSLSKIMEMKNGNNEEEFLKTYRKIDKIYELLGPSEIKVEPTVRNSVEALRKIYWAYKKRFGREFDPKKIEEDIRDVRNALYESMKIKDLEPKTSNRLIDSEYLEKIRSEIEPEDTLIVDMASVLNRYVLKIRDNPWADIVYGDIIKSIENSIDRWRKRESSPEESYESFIKEMEKINEMEEERGSLALNDTEFAMFVALRNKFGRDADAEYLRFISSIMETLRSEELLFPGWYEKSEGKRRVGETIRKELLHFLVVERKMSYEEAKGMLDAVIESLMEILERSGP